VSEDILNASAQSRLRSIVERIERLEEDKAAVANDIKEVFGEAKGEGYDVKILRKVVRLRKQDKAKRQEEEALLDLYMSAIEGSTDSDTRVTISAAGLHVETTVGAMRQATDDLAIYNQAVDIVRRDRKASTSYVQRRLQLGYNRAAALIERMEREGIVGPANHAGKREVLLEAVHG
jgi:uncharacterized protein (UPF0335 family)